jgi:hypothetical protein
MGNLGKYGCLYQNTMAYPGVTLPFQVKAGNKGTMQCYLNPRGGHFLGAARIAGGVPGDARGVPRIEPPEAVRLASVPIPQQSQDFSDAYFVGLAVGGEANTPVALDLVWTPG